MFWTLNFWFVYIRRFQEHLSNWMFVWAPNTLLAGSSEGWAPNGRDTFLAFNRFFQTLFNTLKFGFKTLWPFMFFPLTLWTLTIFLGGGWNRVSLCQMFVRLGFKLENFTKKCINRNKGYHKWFHNSLIYRARFIIYCQPCLNKVAVINWVA